MNQLFPELEPRNQWNLEVGNGHQIYVEEAGSPAGIPVIFLHGGPGSGCNPNHRRYFDPGKYRIIIFDQRGCNRSTPAGYVEHNTTQDLLADMERIRETLGIEQWLVFGGSWGATLSLLYAEQHPQRVLGMILRGTFLARQSDLDWFIRAGANRVFPDYWKEFIDPIPPGERDDLVAAYHQRVHQGTHETQETFARLWSRWAGRVVTYNLPEINEEESEIETVIHEVLIETHYAKHRYFIEENQILENIHSVPAVPTLIIHGRKDLTCTLEASWKVHQAVPGSELVIVRTGGHLAGEPPMTDALVTATNTMAGKLS